MIELSIIKNAFSCNQGIDKNIATIENKPKNTENDYVTSRIMWLEGQENGVNKGPGIDSYERYIYIHGTHEEGLIGVKASHGCIILFL